MIGVAFRGLFESACVRTYAEAARRGRKDEAGVEGGKNV